MKNRIESWAARTKDPDAREMKDTLFKTFKPHHEPTLKLLWYLDIAHAEWIGGAGHADHSALAALRDFLSET